MKLRIMGNSLMFRITQSELSTLIESGCLEETIYFSLDGYSRLTYALEHEPRLSETTLRYQSSEISIVLSALEVQHLAETDRPGIYVTIDLGVRGTLEILVEKDFEVLDRGDPNEPNRPPGSLGKSA